MIVLTTSIEWVRLFSVIVILKNSGKRNTVKSCTEYNQNICSVIIIFWRSSTKSLTTIVVSKVDIWHKTSLIRTNWHKVECHFLDESKFIQIEYCGSSDARQIPLRMRNVRFGKGCHVLQKVSLDRTLKCIDSVVFLWYREKNHDWQKFYLTVNLP